MKNILVLFLLGFTLATCNKSNDLKSDCIDQILSDNDMIKYDGEIMADCKFYLHLYDWDGDQYFIFDNPCMDMVLAIFDCEGNDLCKDDPNCSNFFQNAELVGTIGRSR